MDSNSKKRNFTSDFSKSPVEFMEKHTMTADFGKGLQDNYRIRTNPNMTIPVNDKARTGFQKFFGLNKTTPVSEETQRRTILSNATQALTESGLKTHFLKVMEDKDRKGVFNLTPDIQAYRNKYTEKQKKYESLGDKVTEKQTRKLNALKTIVSSFDKIEEPNQHHSQADEHLQAGYFPYKTIVGHSGDGVGVADLYSKKNSTGRWVFTGQMNGCAIAIQNTLDKRLSSSSSVSDSKAYHFPSPASMAPTLKRWEKSKQLTSWFGVGGYENKDSGNNVDAFNALHVKDADVHLFSQKQTRFQGHTTATGEVNVFKANSQPLDHGKTLLSDSSGVFGLTHQYTTASSSHQSVSDHSTLKRTSSTESFTKK